MLEILLLIFLSKKIAANAEEKGYGGVLFVLLFLGCWIFGEIAGGILGILLFQNFLTAWVVGVASAFGGTIFAFSVVALLPNNSEERFDSLGRHRITGKSRPRRRPRAKRDDSFREKFQPRRQEVEELEIIEDDLEIIEDDLEIIEEAEAKKPPPRKIPQRPPVRKPPTGSDGARIQKPQQKIPPQPPLRKPGTNRDGSRPPER